MEHHHGRRQLVQRQHQRQQVEEGIRTVVSVKVVTMANTHSGNVVWVTQAKDEATTKTAAVGVTLADPITKAKPSSKKESATKSSAQSKAQETTTTTTKEATTKASSQHSPSTIMPATPSIRTQRTISTAPRLSLRPVTEFSSTFSENQKSGGNMLNVAVAGAPSQSRGSLSPDTPSSPWERPGAGNATNPFNDPQPRPSSPQNPFGNNATINDTPKTPQSVQHPQGLSTDAVNDAPAAVVAAIPVAPARREVPPPPSIKESLPPSPSWTEDIPASPGPAPSGPPPVAVAGGNVHGPAPAPAPANNVYRILLQFQPSMADELELTQGQLVRMLHEYDDGWALCTRMDRQQQGVVPRSCLSKHPVKPRTGPPRQGPPGPRMRGPPTTSPMGPGGVAVPRPLTPSSGRNSPQPPFPVSGRNSPGPRAMSPGPLRMSPPSTGPPGRRVRSNSNAPYAGPPRSMSPGPYGGGPQQQLPPPQMSRPRANSAGDINPRRGPAPGPSPMNPNLNMPVPSRKPLPGQAL
ncbi:hypothetical protein K504DRAFT_184976 [Pleomassaria siparia CBS 279.74]|uniref:SH3 domain-containing protein n=1 Tax=Pleomassaria siparia CBS 279.74 TaxID=1314801 RepID=A0A6G1JS65_9PLEO|nr:hypothetical protein K504DRAFT_184976 [Pleomassaria siparia CBS 279.74]